MMPQIPELPANLPAVTFDPVRELTATAGDVVDFGENKNEETSLLLQSQARMAGW